MCQKLPKLPLDDFVDGLLDDESQAAVAAHLQKCPTCAAHVETLHKTRGLLQRVKPVSASPQFEHRLEAHLRREDLKREGLKLLALGLAAVATLLRLLAARPGRGRTPAASTPSDRKERTNTPLRR